MERKPIVVNPVEFPEIFRPLLAGHPVYDSSCSPLARVYFLDRDGGLFLKTAPRGTLAREAAMDRFFHSRGLGPQVLAYECLDKDWLLTVRVPGEDCTHSDYLNNPGRLCDTTAELLRQLHDTDSAGCPVERTSEYLATARRNRKAGCFDLSLFGDRTPFATAEEAWALVEQEGHSLQTDTLLHGDYCLPNILLDNWRFSGFIDLDTAGVGDRHVDLFWGRWTLEFNLKTDRYANRFLDAYGRDKVCPELLDLVAAVEVFG